MQVKHTYEMLRESAHSQGQETCAERAPQRTPKCIPVFHHSDHPELGNTVSHPFDKHLHTYSMIVQHFDLTLSYITRPLRLKLDQLPFQLSYQNRATFKQHLYTQIKEELSDCHSARAACTYKVVALDKTPEFSLWLEIIVSFEHQYIGHFLLGRTNAGVERATNVMSYSIR